MNEHRNIWSKMSHAYTHPARTRAIERGKRPFLKRSERWQNGKKNIHTQINFVHGEQVRSSKLSLKFQIFSCRLQNVSKAKQKEHNILQWIFPAFDVFDSRIWYFIVAVIRVCKSQMSHWDVYDVVTHTSKRSFYEFSGKIFAFFSR